MTGRLLRRGVLLAGGASRRFGGRPKGLEPLGPRRIADYPLRALEACCDSVVIASGTNDAAEWFPGVPVIADVTPGCGALGALQTALHAAGGGTAVVCAWDMPFVTAEVLEALVTAVEEGATCCVPRHANGLLEPLCGAYGPDCADVATMLLASGERTAHALFDDLRRHAWPTCGLPFDDAAHLFFNVNTAEDLRWATDSLAPRAGHR